MIRPPNFASLKDYVERLDDGDFWSPYLSEIRARQDLPTAGDTTPAGRGATYPTFLCGDLVIKLFGGPGPWRQAYAAERAAYDRLARDDESDPRIAAPRLLDEGRLFEVEGAPWPYLITSRLPGIAVSQVDLTDDQRLALAVELGRQVRSLHRLAPSGLATLEAWPTFDLTAGLARSSLPPQLAVQAEAFLAKLSPFETVFTHGDLTASHVFLLEGRFAGIIDWGDALAADRHMELIQPYRDLFACDKALFHAFLEASDWPVGPDFDRKTLGLALIRQAVGAAQHHTMDVFEPIAERYRLAEIATLDELAVELFAL